MAPPEYREQTIDLPDHFVPGRIGVVTVTFGSGQVLPDFFASLDRQTYSNFLLISVDNASKDGTLEQLRAYKGRESVLIANEANLGVAAGNNQGIRAAIAAGCEHVLLLNNDVVFGPDLFQQLVDGLSDHNCQMTTPLIHYYDQPDVIWCAGGYFQPLLGYRCLHYGDGEKDQGQYSSVRAVQYAPTCCVLIHRTVFGQIGLMDERYFVYFDDTDFMLRAWKGGQTLFYLPHATLLHKVSSLTKGESAFTTHYCYRNRALFLGKHIGPVSTMALTACYQSYFIFRRLLGQDNLETHRLKANSWRQGIAIRS